MNFYYRLDVQTGQFFISGAYTTIEPAMKEYHQYSKGLFDDIYGEYDGECLCYEKDGKSINLRRVPFNSELSRGYREDA